MDEQQVPAPSQVESTDTKPPAPWTLGDIVICVGGGGLSGIVLGVLLLSLLDSVFGPLRDSVVYAIGGSSIYLMVPVFVWVWIIRRRNVSWRTIGFRPVQWPVLLWMIPATIGLFFVSGIVAIITSIFFEDVPDAGDQLAVSTQFSVTDLVVFLVTVAIIGPLVEELVFRGLLQKYVHARRGLGAALVISSVVFAIFHFTPVLLAVFFVMGFAFGLAAYATESLYPAIALHSLSNALSVFILYASVN
jgi:uncharacterized protein